MKLQAQNSKNCTKKSASQIYANFWGLRFNGKLNKICENLGICSNNVQLSKKQIDQQFYQQKTVKQKSVS